MKTVAIISEYNPFHSGHKYQIERIRHDFDEDVAIIAIMSGNFTQRGDVAFCDKLTRAKIAVECGVDLVLEMPFPYCCAPADIFAYSGVYIANAIGIVDHLSFGSESGSIEELTCAVEITEQAEYQKLVKELSKDRIGYAKACQLAYERIMGNDLLSFSPNNILAMEYIRALKKLNSAIKPHTVKRCGADYNEETVNENAPHQSASAIRALYTTDADSALEYTPKEARNILQDAFSKGELPCSSEKISSAILSYYRINRQSPSCTIYDAGSGLYNRLRSASFEAQSISSLIKNTETKKYTNAKIRRAMWSGFFGVTSSDMKTPPAFCQVLAMNTVGINELRRIGEDCPVKILTKPSDYKDFKDSALRQKELSEASDAIFELTKPIPKSGRSALRLTPYVKK